MKRSLFVISLILFISCASSKAYNGPKLPKEETVLVTAQKKNSEYMYEMVAIYFVDSISIGNKMKGFPSKIYIKPGINKIQVGYLNSNESNGGQGAIGVLKQSNDDYTHSMLEFDAVLGHSYIIKFHSKYHTKSSTEYWIENIATSEVVAGSKP